MRISDWSSDVCSSDLDAILPLGSRLIEQRNGSEALARFRKRDRQRERIGGDIGVVCGRRAGAIDETRGVAQDIAHADRPLGARKSVVSGTSVSVRVDLGGRRTIKKKKTQENKQIND